MPTVSVMQFVMLLVPGPRHHALLVHLLTVSPVPQTETVFAAVGLYRVAFNNRVKSHASAAARM
eukprot:12169-Chlamydomonas_euryale.AAC.6